MAAVFYPLPTVNKLDHAQRMRLVRSNRKLEAVLGTAPYYLEPQSPDMPSHKPTSKAHRREARVFDHSPSSSTSSTSTLISEKSYIAVPKSRKPSSPLPNPKLTSNSKSTRGLELSRPLLLRLRSVPIPPVTPPPLSSRLDCASPTSPTFTITLDNLQATTLEKRRQKMAKLTRTLGENVPPELVFPAKATLPAPTARARRRERKPLPSAFVPSPPASAPLAPRNTCSVPAPPPATALPPATAPPPAPANPPISQPKPRRPSVSGVPSATTPTPKPKGNATTLAERRHKPRPRSLSLSTGTDMFAAAARVLAPAPYQTVDDKATRDVMHLGSRSPAAFQSTITIPISEAAAAEEEEEEEVTPVQTQHRYARSSPSNIDSTFAHRPSTPSHTKSASASVSGPGSGKSGAPSAFNLGRFGKRKEKGWSGEWNQDMGEVVKVLRGLKVR
ncbi:hypothetical protein FPV67DRAFT_302462 [Lyophyllum atratum]|nr:hypothetical protein FPV67DRAFT_302462 [Lyophyllum atratum]